MPCRANGIRLFLIQMHSPIVGTMAPHDQSIPLGFSMPCRDAMLRVFSPTGFQCKFTHNPYFKLGP
jgi:hypothetical protein